MSNICCSICYECVYTHINACLTCNVRIYTCNSCKEYAVQCSKTELMFTSREVLLYCSISCAYDRLLYNLLNEDHEFVSSRIIKCDQIDIFKKLEREKITQYAQQFLIDDLIPIILDYFQN